MDFLGLFVVVSSLNFYQCNHEEGEMETQRSKTLRTVELYTLPPFPFILRRAGPTLSPIPDALRYQGHNFLPHLPDLRRQYHEHKFDTIYRHHHLNGYPDLHGVSVSPYHYHNTPTAVDEQSNYIKRRTRTPTVLNAIDHDSNEWYSGSEHSDISGKSDQHKHGSSQLKKLYPTHNVTGKHLGQATGASGSTVGSVIQVNVMLSLLLMCKLAFWAQDY